MHNHNQIIERAKSRAKGYAEQDSEFYACFAGCLQAEISTLCDQIWHLEFDNKVLREELQACMDVENES